MNRGKAKVGEKTFLDGIDPAINSLKESLEHGLTVAQAAEKAVQAANDGYEHTATLLAVHGRAATRGEASRSLKDPGAYVAVLMMQGLVRVSAKQ